MQLNPQVPSVLSLPHALVTARLLCAAEMGPIDFTRTVDGPIASRYLDLVDVLYCNGLFRPSNRHVRRKLYTARIQYGRSAMMVTSRLRGFPDGAR